MHDREEVPPLIAEEDKRYLLKKLWCHGQLLSPIQGIITTAWSIVQFDNVLMVEFIYCVIAILCLPIWSFLSWRSMNGKYPKPSILIRFGIILLCYYVGISIITGKYLSQSTFTLCIFIFTVLQFIETSAYLIMVKLLIRSLENEREYETF
eukprot:274010_1